MKLRYAKHHQPFLPPFEDRCCLYLVMELCEGGELFDRLVEDLCQFFHSVLVCRMWLSGMFLSGSNVFETV